MFVDRAVVILVMKVSVVQEIDMIAVLDRGVAAPFPVLMLVLLSRDVFFTHDLLGLPQDRGWDNH